ncbi:hypothetical protein KI387_014910 [Taxus chinensis]|uniref:Uncharacterized protein n=1 Tax=Taxus chinensis TaxID=29808 RepID=A0AA38FIE8_TAXCH|nr:hypothetical protein KI387_014910 [Taxus chinensis]
MATRYGASSFSRTARSAFNSFRNSSASQSSRTPRRTRNLFENGSPSMNRRRLAETMIPLHNAAACAKLVTHLSVSSRSCRALASGFSHLMNHTLGIKQVVMAIKDEGSICSVIAKGRGLCYGNCWVEATSPNPFPSLTEKNQDNTCNRNRAEIGAEVCPTLHKSSGFLLPFVSVDARRPMLDKYGIYLISSEFYTK